MVTDQLGNEIKIAGLPLKIVSLVPSQTEFLHALDLENEVVGITKFCVHPTVWFRNKKRVGGTKTLNIELIRSLQPNIIFANKEENVKEQIELLKEICPVYVSDVNTLEDALQMMADIGVLTGKKERAAAIINQVSNAFQQLKPAKQWNVAYLIWRDPYMAAGGDTFISDMMQRCGFINIFQHQTRYPAVLVEQLREMNCECLLLSSEPFPFTQKHVDELQPLLPGTKIILVDGEMFSWYGSRLVEAAKYFEEELRIKLKIKY